MKTITITLEESQAIHDAIPPTAGVPVGGGVHVVIPDDWDARVRAGERVSGCTYFAPGDVTLTAAEEVIIDAAADVRLASVQTALSVAVEELEP